MSLMQISQQLNIAKRRLYDVVNILEAAQVLRKIKTDSLMWYGVDALPTALQQLKVR